MRFALLVARAVVIHAIHHAVGLDLPSLLFGGPVL